MSEPVLVETANDNDGMYWVEWYCEPPDYQESFQVIRQEWGTHHDGCPVRRIYEVRPSSSPRQD